MKDLNKADDPLERVEFLSQLRKALFEVGFLHIANHGVSENVISSVIERVPAVFDLPAETKAKYNKVNSPHFLGYTENAVETNMYGTFNYREQFEFATELPVIHDKPAVGLVNGRDFSKNYWRLRGPNQWPTEDKVPGFRVAMETYHDALSELSYKFVELVEEAFGFPVGTFNRFFRAPSVNEPSTTSPSTPRSRSSESTDSERSFGESGTWLKPQRRYKLNKYPPTNPDDMEVGPHRDTSGWLTFLLQIGQEKGLEVLDKHGAWIPADPIPGTLVVNFGNAFEAATEDAVRATAHRVKAPTERTRYSIPFFMGLPLDLKLKDIRSFVPEEVRRMRREDEDQYVADAGAMLTFLDPRWDTLGDPLLRKCVRQAQPVGMRHYGEELTRYYAGEHFEY